MPSGSEVATGSEGGPAVQQDSTTRPTSSTGIQHLSQGSYARCKPRDTQISMGGKE